MPELTLQRVEPGRYRLGELGTLQSGRRFAAEIEADGTVWNVRRGFGQSLSATDSGTDAEPVSVALFGSDHLQPLPLLFCCHMVKHVVDTAMEVGSPGAPRPPGG